MVRLGRNIAPMDSFDFAGKGPEQLVAVLLREVAGELPHGLVGQIWDERRRCYIYKDVSYPEGKEASAEQIAWLIMLTIADLFEGQDTNWKVRLQRHRQGPRLAVDHQIQKAVRNWTIAKRVAEHEQTVPRKAAV